MNQNCAALYKSCKCNRCKHNKLKDCCKGRACVVRECDAYEREVVSGEEL